MAQNEMRKKALDDARKAMTEQREEREKRNALAYERMETAQPTPTQEENDLARLGCHVEQKQDDRSGETVIERTVVANVPLGPHGYTTRSVRSKSE
jgi:hypothetical protein